MDNSMCIAVMEIKGQIKTTDGLVNKLKAAMKIAKSHWLVTDDGKRFECAVGAVLCSVEGEDEARLLAELECLKVVSAMINGISVNLDEVPTPKNPIGLHKLWKEATDEETTYPHR